MNSARTRSLSRPSALMISETSNSVVGQKSGQWVKPKNTKERLAEEILVGDGAAVLVGQA